MNNETFKGYMFLLQPQRLDLQNTLGVAAHLFTMKTFYNNERDEKVTVTLNDFHHDPS